MSDLSRTGNPTDPSPKTSGSPTGTASGGLEEQKLESIDFGAERLQGRTFRSMLRYLSYEDVRRVALPAKVIQTAVQQVLLEKGLGCVEAPPKRGIVPKPDSSIRAMKGFVPSMGAAGVKWISAFPGNAPRSLPTISGLLILNDLETGFPKTVMDCSWITAMRTAACTAVAAKHLARNDSESVGLVACGLQARENLRVLHGQYDLKTVRAYDIDPQNAERFASEMSEELGIEVLPVSSAEGAVREMDIVVTSCPIQKDPVPTIQPGWLARGSFAALLDFDASIQGPALRALDRFITDDIRQLAFFKEIGYLRDTPEPDADLGKVVAARVQGRTSPTETIASMNLGIGVLDIAIACLIHERAMELEVGHELPL